MQKDMNIPDELNLVVENSLRQVRRLHRGKMLRRAGTVCGSFVILIAAFLVFGYTNPVLASQIPLLGRLFSERAVNNKISVGNENVADYGVVEQISKTADSTVRDCSLIVEEGYCDSNRLQLVLRLDAPEEFKELYDTIEVDAAGSLVLNGETAEYKISSFLLRDGEWLAFLEAKLPDEDLDTISVELTLGEMNAIEKPKPGIVYSEENPIPRSGLEGTFNAGFEVKVDKSHEFGFECGAEDNGAEIYSVSGTPIQTVIKMHKPFWGETTPLPEDAAMGIPELLTMDGTKVQILYGDSRTEGGYDAMLREPQDAALYFDGLPAGTTQFVLRFHKDKYERKEVLAEFTVDIEKQTVTPSKTYEEEGALNIANPYAYDTLQNGSPGKEQNGMRVASVVFDHWEGAYSGSVSIEMREGPLPERGYRVELLDSEENILVSEECTPDKVGVEGLDLNEMDYGEGKVWRLSLRKNIRGIEVPIGEAVTVRITDLSSGEIVLTDNRVMDCPSYH